MIDHKAFSHVGELCSVLFERFFADWKHLSDEDFLDFLTPKIDQVITLEELKKLLAQNRTLHIKFGIDPTGPDVHLGHVLPLIVLRQFQKAGHKAHLIIGDFTAMIGDPSGRNDQRPSLSLAQIKDNMKTYLAQAGVFLDVKKAKIHHNASWLSKRSFATIISDLSKINLSEVLQRDDFRSRLSRGDSLSVAEILYSYAQGIDSVELAPDIEVGGRDQLLNFAQARTIMGLYDQRPEVALTTPVLEGTAGDGRKMSKSYGNYIAVSESSKNLFGKIMSMPDVLIEKYFIAFADVRVSEKKILSDIIAQDPMEAKKQLAQFLVAIRERSLEKGLMERESFEKQFSKKEYDDVEVFKATPGETFFDFFVSREIVGSKSELHRLFEQGAIRFVEPEEKQIQEEALVEEGVVRVGKKIFLKILFD